MFTNLGIVFSVILCKESLWMLESCNFSYHCYLRVSVHVFCVCVCFILFTREAMQIKLEVDKDYIRVSIVGWFHIIMTDYINRQLARKGRQKLLLSFLLYNQ